tara:strand:- start:1277 stop:1630 length:354 start_codon:yes stop_codon:yes gene_type:complete
MKKIVIMGGAGVMLYLYLQSDKPKPPKTVKFIVDGNTVLETELAKLQYHFYQTDNGDIPSGYYKYTSFPSGFGEALDKDYVPSAFKHIQEQSDIVQVKNSQILLKKYYNGDLPLQTT